MRSIITAAILLGTIHAAAQSTIIPARKVAEKKWLINRSYQMKWYAIQDSNRFEIGKITTQINNDRKKIIVVTNVQMKRATTVWIDSTIANTKDLSPVYHSSSNAQREMALHFGKIVTGFYRDKIKNTTTVINDTTKAKYFDSNLYPVLITWLPLQEGYKKDISIYDFTPATKSGLIKATIQNVTKGIYTSKISGAHDVWIVKVSDEIGGGGNGSGTYYIDIADRKLWKQQIEAGGRKMEMELIEE